MTESLFWSSTVRPKLGMFGILRRMENRVGEGTPDVCYCIRRHKTGQVPAASGWMELKHLYEWPKGDKTLVRWNHFTLEQVNWIEEWHEGGGRACVLAQVERDYMLFPPWTVRRVQAGAPKDEMISLADVYSRGTFPTANIIRWLTR